MAAEKLGTAIRRARNRRRWTQMQLAERAGVSVRTVGDWERGVKVPRNLTVVEDILGVRLDEAEEEDPTEQAIMALDAPERLRLDWVDQFRRAKREPARRSALPPAQ
jgi:transcriptional regulator with XRE-family HTH domain